MKSLTNKEVSAIRILTDQGLKEAANEIKFNARLRQDGFRKPVKVFLSVITKYQNDKIISNLK